MNYQFVIAPPENQSKSHQNQWPKANQLESSQVQQMQQQTLSKQPKIFKPPKRIRRKFWKLEEKKLYLEFLQNNLYEFAKPLKEKILGRINVKMSKHIKTKSSKQCRSHHQKMIQKWGSVEKILANERKSQGTWEMDKKHNQFNSSRIEQLSIQYLQLIYPQHLSQEQAIYVINRNNSSSA